MPRIPHILKNNHSCESPANVIWFDTETKHKTDSEGRQHHYLWFGWACYQRREKGQTWSNPEWFRFDSIPVFWEWVNSKARKKTRLYLFAHNGGFDLPVMHAFTELPKMGFDMKSAVADAPPLVITWKMESRTIRFVDTLNIWRMSLAKIGESIGHDKLPMPAPKASKADWDAYGKQDTEIIRIACLEWWAFLIEFDLGGFAPTLASQAFNAYRHRFMHTPIFIDVKEKALALARSAYVGGRTECFNIGHMKGDFYYIDFNSMYPAVMQKEKFPFRLIGNYQRPTKKELADWQEHFSILAEVTITTDLPIYPVIRDKKLIFPIGTFKVTLAHPEYCEAVLRGHVDEVHQVCLYQSEQLFKSFIDTMYELRLKAKAENNETKSWLFKILQNSLYGKFGQRGRRFEEIDTCEPNLIEVWDEYDADTHELLKFRKFGGVVQQWIDEDESRNSFPAIAATVTSYARVKLFKAIEQAGFDNVFYCDTDSLVTNAIGFKRLSKLIDDKKLGYLKLEKRFTEMEIYSPKDYVFGNVCRTKGVKANALWLNRNTVEQDQFTGFKGLLRSKNLESPVVYKITKKLSREYNKGIVTKSGKVEPFVMSLTG